MPLGVALLAVLALAVGAATLDSASSGSFTGSGEGTGLTDGDQRSADLGSPPAESTSEGGLFPTWLAQLLVALILVAGFVGLLEWVRRDGLDFVKKVVLGAFALAGILIVVYYLLEWFARAASSAGESGLLGDLRPELPSGGGGGSGSEVTQVASDPSVVMLAIVAIILVGAVAVVLRSLSGDGDDDDPVVPEPDDPDPSVQQVGEAAGRAADRIDATGDVENAVYRAWREMTDPLDLSRETSTPGEFAAAAVDAGMSREDVGELTRLFESTRYGGVAVDEGREERATTALRSIERTYGDGR